MVSTTSPFGRLVNRATQLPFNLEIPGTESSTTGCTSHIIHPPRGPPPRGSSSRAIYNNYAIVAMSEQRPLESRGWWCKTPCWTWPRWSWGGANLDTFNAEEPQQIKSRHHHHHRHKQIPNIFPTAEPQKTNRVRAPRRRRINSSSKAKKIITTKTMETKIGARIRSCCCWSSSSSSAQRLRPLRMNRHLPNRFLVRVQKTRSCPMQKKEAAATTWNSSEHVIIVRCCSPRGNLRNLLWDQFGTITSQWSPRRILKGYL